MLSDRRAENGVVTDDGGMSKGKSSSVRDSSVGAKWERRSCMKLAEISPIPYSVIQRRRSGDRKAGRRYFGAPASSGGGELWPEKTVRSRKVVIFATVARTTVRPKGREKSNVNTTCKIAVLPSKHSENDEDEVFGAW